MRTKILALAAAFGLGSVGVLAAWPADESQADAKAKADPPKAEAPKADPPKEDFNRPPRDKRAKLVDSIDEIEVVGGNLSAIWPEGGKRLILLGSFRGNKSPSSGATGIALTRTDLPGYFGVLDGGKKWIGRELKGAGVNSVARLVTWDFTDATRPTTNGLSAVEYDRSADGDPCAVSPDGKTVFTLRKQVDEAAGGKARSRSRTSFARWTPKPATRSAPW